MCSEVVLLLIVMILSLDCNSCPLLQWVHLSATDGFFDYTRSFNTLQVLHSWSNFQLPKKDCFLLDLRYGWVRPRSGWLLSPWSFHSLSRALSWNPWSNFWPRQLSAAPGKHRQTYHETSTGFLWKSHWNNGKHHMGQNFRTVGQPFKLPVSFAGSADGFDNFPVSWWCQRGCRQTGGNELLEQGTMPLVHSTISMSIYNWCARATCVYDICIDISRLQTIHHDMHRYKYAAATHIIIYVLSLFYTSTLYRF